MKQYKLTLRGAKAFWVWADNIREAKEKLWKEESGEYGKMRELGYNSKAEYLVDVKVKQVY